MAAKILHPFSTQDGKPNLDAAREQASVILSLYCRSQDGAKTVIELDGLPTTDYAFNFTPNAWTGDAATLVNYARWTQQGQMWVAIAGTENLYQWNGNLAGMFFRPDFNGTNALCNSFFDDMAVSVRAALPSAWFVANPRGTVNISGHSLGGAAGYLMACKLKKQFPGLTVNVMTFGEPRSLTENYDGPQPDTHFRIVQTGDVVSVLGPSNNAFGYRYVSPFNKDFGRVVNLAHFGSYHWMFLNGDFSPDPDNGIDPTTKDNVLPASPTSHYITSYTVSLYLNFRNNGGDSRAADIEQLNALVQEGVDSSPSIKSFDLTEFFDPSQANLVLFPSRPNTITRENFRQIASTGGTIYRASATLSAGSNLGESDMGSPSGIWKATVPVSNDVMSHSVSFVTAADTDIDVAAKVMLDIIDRYTNLMGNDLTTPDTANDAIPGTGGSPRVQVWHLTDAKRSRIGKPFVATAAGSRGYPGDSGNSPADVLTTALSIRLKGVTPGASPQESYHTLTIVGQPDAVVQANRFVGAVNVRKNATTTIPFRQQLIDVLNALVNPANKMGFMGVDRSVPLKVITGFGVGVGGEVVCNLMGHGLVDGEHVQLLRTDKAYRKDWPVRKITDDSFALIGSQTTTATLPKLAKMRKTQNADGTNTLVFYGFKNPAKGWADDFPIVKITKRNPARLISAVSFPRKGKKAK